jgi:hypothetical protein
VSFFGKKGRAWLRTDVAHVLTMLKPVVRSESLQIGYENNTLIVDYLKIRNSRNTGASDRQPCPAAIVIPMLSTRR